ncbi:MAG TPA: cytochrome c3 family protein [Candidatus Binatia bacterium]
MKSSRMIPALVAVLVTGTFPWLGAHQAMGQLPTPPDFSYEDTKPMPPVTFSHKFHVTEKKQGCPECHTKVFQMKKMAASPEMTMPKLNEGQFCGACHNGTKAFATKDMQSCVKCHVKK